MWAACSSQNTNVPCESEKGEKVSLSQGQSSKHGEREHLCFYQGLFGTEQFNPTGNHIWSECEFNVALESDDETLP